MKILRNSQNEFLVHKENEVFQCARNPQKSDFLACQKNRRAIFLNKLLVLALFLFFVSFVYAKEIKINASVGNPCDISMNISAKIENEKITFKPILDKKIKNFTLEYWIEGLDGYLVKKKINTTNLNEKYFTAKTDYFVIKNKLYYNCKNESYIINANKSIDLQNSEEIETEESYEEEITNSKNLTKNSKIIYESGNIKNIKNAKYLFLILIATFILIFIWKKE